MLSYFFKFFNDTGSYNVKVWLFKVHEPIPFGEMRLRAYRMGILAERLSRKDDVDIVWFNSRFDHSLKKNRRGESSIYIKQNLRVELLQGRPYRKSLSYRRFKSEEDMAQDFITRFSTIDKKYFPDIILTAMPSLSLAYKAVEFAKTHKIPVVVDLRDMWPDVFGEKIFPFMPSLGRLFFRKQFKQIKYITSQADAIWGITKPFLNWGLHHASRERREHDQVFHLLGREPEKPSFKGSFRAKLEKIAQNKTVITYCGTISKAFEFDYLVSELKKSHSKKHIFFIAGHGDYLPELEKKTKNLSNVHLLGWLNQDEINQLYGVSHYGLAHYVNRKDFKMSVPNKIIEYLRHQLPIIYSLEGETDRLLSKNEAGIKFNAKKVGDFSRTLEQLSSICFDRRKLAEAYSRNFSFEKTYDGMCSSLEKVARFYGQFK